MQIGRSGSIWARRPFISSHWEARRAIGEGHSMHGQCVEWESFNCNRLGSLRLRCATFYSCHLHDGRWNAHAPDLT